MYVLSWPYGTERISVCTVVAVRNRVYQCMHCPGRTEPNLPMYVLPWPYGPESINECAVLAVRIRVYQEMSCLGRTEANMSINVFFVVPSDQSRTRIWMRSKKFSKHFLPTNVQGVPCMHPRAHLIMVPTKSSNWKHHPRLTSLHHPRLNSSN